MPAVVVNQFAPNTALETMGSINRKAVLTS